MSREPFARGIPGDVDWMVSGEMSGEAGYLDCNHSYTRHHRAGLHLRVRRPCQSKAIRRDFLYLDFDFRAARGHEPTLCPGGGIPGTVGRGRRVIEYSPDKSGLDTGYGHGNEFGMSDICHQVPLVQAAYGTVERFSDAINLPRRVRGAHTK